MPELPMFPLGTVLFPSGVLPLHVFEPRYRALVRDCLAGDRRFGVTLIERGSEVGGGDIRAAVGTSAVIAEAEELSDGRWGLVAVGEERIRVTEWLEDAPYPRGLVEPWPDEGPSGDPTRMHGALRRALALAAELGVAVAPATAALADDPVEAAFQAGSLAPIGPADRYAVLAEPGCAGRMARLEQLLDDQIELFELRLASGDG